MTSSKCRILVTAGLLAGLAWSGALSAADEAEKDWTTRIDKRIQAWQPTKEEHFLDQIGWAKDVRDALRLAKEHNRPIFLFTYSGSPTRDHAIALQRC
jgi:hypothetical protein